MLNAIGTVLGVEKKGKKDKPFFVLHLLDGYTKIEVLGNKTFDFGQGEVVEVPVRVYQDKLYAIQSPAF